MALVAAAGGEIFTTRTAAKVIRSFCERLERLGRRRRLLAAAGAVFSSPYRVITYRQRGTLEPSSTS
jgi:hypothetical protein